MQRTSTRRELDVAGSSPAEVMDLSKSLKGSQGPFGPAWNHRFPPDFGAVVAHRIVAPLVVCSNHTSQIGVDSLISESDTGPEGAPPR